MLHMWISIQIWFKNYQNSSVNLIFLQRVVPHLLRSELWMNISATLANTPPPTERQVALRLVRLQGAPSLLDLVETGRLAAAAVLHSGRKRALL